MVPRRAAPLLVLFGAVAFAGVATAQSDAETVRTFGPLVEAVVGVVVYLLIAGLTLALAPDATRNVVGDVREDPLGSFGWGLLANVAFLVVVVALAVTVVGIVLAIPLAIAVVVVSVGGTGMGLIAVGEALTSGDGTAPGGRAVLAGALLVGVLGAVPLLGGLVTWVVNLVGFGALSRRLWRGSDWSGGGGPREATGQRAGGRRV